MTDREQAMAHLLRPIEWHWGSSIRARQNLVISRRTEVAQAFALMSPAEQQQATAWFKREEHAGLWD